MSEPCYCAGAVAEREESAALEAAAAASRVADAERAAEAKRAAAIRKFAMDMPPKLQACSFDNFQVLPHLREAFAAAQRVVGRTDGMGLLLRGDVGTGKTHLAAAIANAEIAAGRSALCGTVPALLSRIRASYGSDVETEMEVMRPFLDCSLLVLDDLGKEKISAFVEEKVYQIIDHRYTHGRRVVITTNVGLDVIQQRYAWNGQAIVSRLFEMCEGVLVKGADFRRRR